VSYRVRYERKVYLGEYETETWALEQEFPPEVPKPDAFRTTRDCVLRAIEESKVVGAPAKVPEAKAPKELTKEDIEGLGWTDYPTGRGQWILWEREGDAGERLAEAIRKEGRDGVLFKWGYRFSFSGAEQQFIRRVPVRAGAR